MVVLLAVPQCFALMSLSSFRATQVYRVLKPGGVYFLVSHAPPKRRLSLLQKAASFSVAHFELAKPDIPGTDLRAVDLHQDRSEQCHHVYICNKGFDDAG